MPDKAEFAASEQTLHDIKTPLSIMYNSIRELEREAIPHPEMWGALETLKRNWLRILKLVTDAGDYRKLSLGLMLPRLASHDVVALIRNITDSTRALTARRGIKLEFRSAMPEKRMAADRDILDRIMLNLLSNAIKFTDDGGGVSVGVREDGGALLITIRDSGSGISAEHAARVFDPHYFVSGPRNSNGTGMGLYIVKQLVELLSGQVWFESSPSGTAVTVKLPCREMDGEAEPEFKYFDDFYSDNMVQIELSDAHYGGFS